MDYASLAALCTTKKSFLCVGLDTDLSKIPSHLLTSPDPVFEFNKQIIDATIDLAVAYKPNIAFYEALGSKGWDSLYKTMEYLPKTVFSIADAKRGDIGNTSAMYAKTFFEYMDFDSVTVAPYMGSDSVQPFLDFKGKWTILLALTSNPGSQDFQQLFSNEKPIYQHVIEKSSEWGSKENLMYVVGATKSQTFEHIRSIAPDHFLLVPGVGAQGGDLDEVIRLGKNGSGGLLINSSRQVLYASKEKDFATKAKEAAQDLTNQMEKYFI